MKKLYIILSEDKVYLYFIVMSVIFSFSAFISGRHTKLDLIENTISQLILLILLFTLLNFNLYLYFRETIIQNNCITLSIGLSIILLFGNYLLTTLLICGLTEYKLSLNVSWQNFKSVLLILNGNILFGNLILGVHQAIIRKPKLKSFHLSYKQYEKLLKSEIEE